MTQERWTAVDRYLTDLLISPDPALEAARRAGAEAGLPPHEVSPTVGKLLHLLARSLEARTILEIGTLGGYSTIWLARALPADGRLITLEAVPEHAAVARANLARAGLASLVEFRLGRALEMLPQLAAERRDPFDLIFIDADKAGNPDYFAWALELSRCMPSRSTSFKKNRHGGAPAERFGRFSAARRPSSRHTEAPTPHMGAPVALQGEGSD